ncbi:hypothetical protein JQX13_11675 [Archangium violaceum]|uniref:hypothetical protein n=1 Tax=Archangium violaceum TaxID=83451 RepID=UPI00193B867D|nr:hypothetical protein [Archangium violaceum]QRK10671.1 hypothetical protein JQX13_11675 [Archangium violaceum]
MNATRICLLVVAGMLTGAPVGVVGALTPEQLRPGVTRCEPGTRDCGAPRHGDETTPRASSTENHPCDWVETCQVPCGSEGGDCCHAEWNCPPDANLPRC